MNTELPALMATCVVCDAGSRGQKSSDDLASAVSVILHTTSKLETEHLQFPVNEPMVACPTVPAALRLHKHALHRSYIHHGKVMLLHILPGLGNVHCRMGDMLAILASANAMVTSDLQEHSGQGCRWKSSFTCKGHWWSGTCS